MPDELSLLPSNATDLERSLSAAMDSERRLSTAGQLLRTSKRLNIPDSVVPWLIYEYGLGELLPYLEDPRTAISTGVLWQRLRGTPESFRIALSWIGNDGRIEESEEGSIRWAQFQLGLDNAPNGLSGIDSVVELARLSSPVRSSLFRIYGGWYDGRRFRLDEHHLSSLNPLCDHTGVYLRDGLPQLSFGRLTEGLWRFDSDDAEISVHRFKPTELVYEDRFILDQSGLSEFWHLLEQMQMSATRGHFIIEQPKPARPSTTWTDSPQQTWSTALAWSTNFSANKLEFCKAGIYLGDGAVLGDTNACLPAYYEASSGDEPFTLSHSILSENVESFDRFEILERFERDHDGGATQYVQLPASASEQRQHFIEDQAITVGVATSEHRRTVIAAAMPTDVSTWAADETWLSSNSWEGLEQLVVRDRAHTVEALAGETIGAFIYASHTVTTLVAPSTTIAESYARNHTDESGRPTINPVDTWASITSQTAGNWLGEQGHIISSSGDTVDSDPLASTVTFPLAVEASGHSFITAALAVPAESAAAARRRDVSSSASFTSAGSIWTSENTWAELDTWQGVFPVETVSRTLFPSELTHTGVAIESNIAEIALDTETGPAPVDRVETLFEHPDYFAQPDTWTTAGITWEEGSVWTPLLAGRGRNHADETPWATSAESTNHASQVLEGASIEHPGTAAELAIGRGYTSRAFVEFFRTREGWRTDSTWGSIYGWTELGEPETSRTRLRREFIEHLFADPAADPSALRNITAELFPDDRFLLDENGDLSEFWHRPEDPQFRSTTRTSTAYYPVNRADWSTGLPWAGVWAWLDNFGEPITHHSRSTD